MLEMIISYCKWIVYSSEIYINNTKWSVAVLYPEILAGTYEVTTTRTSNNKVVIDKTTNELVLRHYRIHNCNICK
jgi:hypothetical protein